MKNNKIIIMLFLIGILIITIFALYNFFSSDKSVIDKNFDVDFHNFKLQKVKEKEEWSPNGDGIKIQVFEFKNWDKTNINGLESLPVKYNLPPNEIPREFINNTNGYYKCIINKEDNRNFDILIIDTLKKKICVYYQIM
ncbi:hypothetical protein [Apibacter sp. HY039]|uniref:hypothetical protein n=1 Tax=Apibacter sp. HY039 TaxID=2501476 RepID=UPI000FEBD29D|nr:hypothetical protein [Apibacter sp. HY039]